MTSKDILDLFGFWARKQDFLFVGEVEKFESFGNIKKISDFCFSVKLNMLDGMQYSIPLNTKEEAERLRLEFVEWLENK